MYRPLTSMIPSMWKISSAAAHMYPVLPVLPELRFSYAAADLGANPARVFFKITLPFSVPGILSGVAMVFVPSVTTFAISQTVGNGKIRLIGDLIQDQYMTVSNWQFGGAISIVTMAVVLLLMYFINRTDSEENGGGILKGKSF